MTVQQLKAQNTSYRLDKEDLEIELKKYKEAYFMMRNAAQYVLGYSSTAEINAIKTRIAESLKNVEMILKGAEDEES